MNNNNVGDTILEHMNYLVELTNNDPAILPDTTLEIVYHNSRAVLASFSGLQNSKAFLFQQCCYFCEPFCSS